MNTLITRVVCLVLWTGVLWGLLGGVASLIVPDTKVWGVILLAVIGGMAMFLYFLLSLKEVK